VTGWGPVRVQEQAVVGNDPQGGHGRVCEGDRACVGASHGMVEDKLLCIRWLSLFLMKMEQTVCSETYAYKIQMPGNYPEENIEGNVIFLFLLPFIMNLCLLIQKKFYLSNQSELGTCLDELPS
jgi:hypothetical protein